MEGAIYVNDLTALCDLKFNRSLRGIYDIVLCIEKYNNTRLMKLITNRSRIITYEENFVKLKEWYSLMKNIDRITDRPEYESVDEYLHDNIQSIFIRCNSMDFHDIVRGYNRYCRKRYTSWHRFRSVSKESMSITRALCDSKLNGITQTTIYYLCNYCRNNEYTSYFSDVYDELKSMVKYGESYDLANFIWSFDTGHHMGKVYIHTFTENDLSFKYNYVDDDHLIAIQSDIDTGVQIFYSNVTVSILLHAGKTKAIPGGTPIIKADKPCTIKIGIKENKTRIYPQCDYYVEQPINIAVGKILWMFNYPIHASEQLFINGERYDPAKSYDNFLISSFQINNSAGLSPWIGFTS